MFSSTNTSEVTLAAPFDVDLEKKESASSSASEQHDVARVVSIVPGPFGSSSPGTHDTTGPPPPHTVQQALEEQLELEEQDRIRKEKGLVDWEVRLEPAEDPRNWSAARRWYITSLGGILVFNSTFSSSAPSGILPSMRSDLGMEAEVSILVVSLFVLGYCCGPNFWGPLSESYGRRPLILLSFVLYVAFTIGGALSPNTASALIFRLLAGISASAPLVIVGSILGDIFPAETRGMALAIFVVAPFAGPAFGPIVGGYMEVAGVRWTWLFWALSILGGLCLAVAIFTLPETYAPMLLVKKAQRLRKENPGQPWFAPLERQKSGFKARARDVFIRPWAMLAQEPMLLAITAWMSVTYGILYLSFVAYPVIFEMERGFDAGTGGLMFLPIFVGATLASLFSAFFINPRYIKASADYPSGKAPPELRLPPAILGGVFLTLSMFWLAFTSYPSIHWAVPASGGFFLGASLVLIFLPLMAFIVDAYLFAAATALAANTVCRSLAGAVFPLFAKQMFTTLTPRYAGLILALICLILSPIPILLMRYGPALRARSKNSAS